MRDIQVFTAFLPVEYGLTLGGRLQFGSIHFSTVILDCCKTINLGLSSYTFTVLNKVEKR